MKSCVLVLVVAAPLSLAAQVGVSFFGGIALPGDAINDVYNRATVGSGDTLRALLREAVRTGYHIGVRSQTALSRRFSFASSIALVRFPQSRIYVTNPQTGDTALVLVSVQNLVPISAGIAFALLPAPLKLFTIAQLSYTIVNSSIDVERGDLSIPLAIGNQSDHRVGADVGIGAAAGIGPVGIGLELHYAVSNLIGKVEGEKQKGYGSLLLVLNLGL